jgi:hypothetical protein
VCLSCSPGSFAPNLRFLDPVPPRVVELVAAGSLGTRPSVAELT